MLILQTIGCLLAIAVPFGLLFVGSGRLSGSSIHIDSALLLRLLIAVLAFIATSLIAEYLGAKNHFVLGVGVSTIVLVRFHANWIVGIAFFAWGIATGFSGLVNSMLWPPHSVIGALVLNDSLVRGPFTVDMVAAGYGLVICGVVSMTWGAAVGFPPKSLPFSRNKTPFTVETESPDHVIKISKSRS